MALYKSRGIVLRSMRYGEADRILDLYTHDRGVVSAIAKGIRRTKSRFGARLEPLSCVEIMAYEGRTLDTITQAETLRSFHKVRENLGRLEAAGAMIEAVKAFSGGGEGDPRVFNLLYRALDALENRAADFEAVEASLTLKLSVLAGYAPRLEACSGCGADPEVADGLARFSPQVGGALCAECGEDVGDAFALAPGTLGGLRALMSCPVREASFVGSPSESIRRVVGAHVQAHAPGAASLAEPDRRRPA